MIAIITGATGMVGSLVLNHCLQSNEIKEVRSLVRKPTGLKHSKLNETIITNFEDYSSNEALFKNIDIAYFCLGVYTGEVPENEFKIITVNYPVAFAKNIKTYSPYARFCLLSGAGTDRTEKSKTAFARFKGMAENQIAALNLKFHTLRPAYIYPTTKRKEPNLGYTMFRFLYPIIKLFGKKYSIKSTELAAAIFNVGRIGADKEILENEDILKYSL
jgi:uncharacterized protein YbjT (DUF2867 family)